MNDFGDLRTLDNYVAEPKIGILKKGDDRVTSLRDPDLALR
ncbi:hypothetical protein SUDANB180_00378 [Streptomyces sp. enrichment culture]